MMKMIGMLALLFASVPALASITRYGSGCGLTDDYAADSWVEQGRQIDLTDATASDLFEMRSLTRAQLIITARIIAREFSDDLRIESAMDAIRYLRSYSESENLYVSGFKVNGLLFTQVLFYPGGNPGGIIFQAGTRNAVARISDSDVVCR